jgi:hypothetical protein
VVLVYSLSSLNYKSCRVKREFIKNDLYSYNFKLSDYIYVRFLNRIISSLFCINSLNCSQYIYVYSDLLLNKYITIKKKKYFLPNIKDIHYNSYSYYLHLTLFCELYSVSSYILYIYFSFLLLFNFSKFLFLFKLLLSG